MFFSTRSGKAIKGWKSTLGSYSSTTSSSPAPEDFGVVFGVGAFATGEVVSFTSDLGVLGVVRENPAKGFAASLAGSED